MSLLRKMFGDRPPAEGGASRSLRSSRGMPVADSLDDSEMASRGSSRRDVVFVVLRETMRQHGIPSDWIECRTLSMVRSDRSTGTYVTLIVRGGQDRLLPYVPAFQTSLRQALERFDPHVNDWLRGLAWEFEGTPAAEPAAVPVSAPAPLSIPGGLSAGLEVRELGEQPAAAEEDDLEKDLRALFAIRDAALAGRPDPAPPFEATRPG